ncbi:PepSY domain-containing protein [Fictibacillus barbaricus]|uniref:Small secreted protein n=1 Tax=Fictibacillus barbaricus TaxID=182136 RepID=A0ABU1U2X7_9BACL|nr:PepSY domain-containing protein [Fictibacillus barbaricus]MDR7073832.1 putative small secreted protein [Fictibacillus barbaricus]
MKCKTFLIAGLAGAAAGYLITKKRTEWITPEKALKILKEKASSQFSISGAWILTNRDEIEVHNLPYTVYKGGFSHSIEGFAASHYEFLVDAHTGAVLQLNEQ